MEQPIHEQAAELTASLQSASLDGIRKLTEFADTFATDRKLFHRALLLRRQQQAPQTTITADEINRQGQELVQEILANFKADGAASLNRRERVAQSRELMLNVQPARDIVFSCSGLGKSYRKPGFRLQDVNLELRLGEIIGVVGRNANGKTTLLRLLAGELSHDEGTLSYPSVKQYQENGIDWVEVKENIAYLPQDLPAWHGSLRNNLHYEAALHGIRGQANEREVEYIVERLELGNELEKKWKELSGGTKLRFALAKALVWKPKLLILDEPLANLDFKAQQVLLKDVQNLANSLRQPLAVVISSQHLHEVEVVSDHIVFLRQGEVIYNGPRTAIGEFRRYNTFELGVDCDLATLRDVLRKESVLHVYHSGVSYVIRTSLEFSAADLLGELLEAKMKVEYFRDVSRSTKALFERFEEPQIKEVSSGMS